MNQELPIHDIKPLVQINDYSIFVYYGLIVFAISIIGAVIYLFYNFLKKRNHNIRKEYYAILKNCDFSKTKDTAYTITKYGHLLARTDGEKQLLGDLVSKLEIYKYKKDVPSFDDGLKHSYAIFMESVDV